MLITFSGLDGSGKTTLAASLKSFLEQQNLRVTTKTMYGQVSLYGIIRFVRDWIIAATRESSPKKLEKNIISSIPNFSKGETFRYGRIQKLLLNVFRNNTIKRCVYILDIIILSIFRLYFESKKSHFYP